MKLLLASIWLWLLGGLVVGVGSRFWPRIAAMGGPVQIAGGLLAMVAGAAGLCGARQDLVCGLPVVYGQVHLGLDALSGWFLIAIGLLAAVTGAYGTGYWNAGTEPGRHGTGWWLSNWLAAGMALAVVAADAVLFLLAWELMTLASYFLVTYQDEDKTNLRAGWIYLVAAHLGTAFVTVLFMWLGSRTGTLDFVEWAAHPVAGVGSGALFVLALLGFGTKAGFVPLHVWLPEAHPAAPSHISALMSGVMIKTGIYGVVRALTFFDAWPVWWGWVLLVIGVCSGLGGVIFALAQHDLKRLLAYHSVENIGIIALGMGLGLLGVAWDRPAIAVTGWAGALLHVLNHAVFKSLLFMNAGVVAHVTGTRDVEHMGGLLKRMPWTGAAFLIGAVAISGLPPLNGFVSEFLIYVGAFGAFGGGVALIAAAVLVIGTLGLIGGLAATCFAKAFGTVFLGEPRTRHAADAHEAGPLMLWPMWLLALACFGIALGAPLLWPALSPVLNLVCNGSNAGGSGLEPVLARYGSLLRVLALVLCGASAGVGLLWLIARRLPSRRLVRREVTWDCGYARPTARMQYTASSFVQPLTALFGALLRMRCHYTPPRGYFPSGASFSTETPDVTQRWLYAPAFVRMAEAFSRLRRLQHGNVHLYVLYVALTLVVLLIWLVR